MDCACEGFKLWSKRNKPERNFKFSRDGFPCTLLVVYLVDDDVTISQNNGINSSRGIDTRNAFGARRIRKRLASTRLSVNRKKNRIIACEKGYNSYRVQKLA